jgi:DNA-binding GntR family transcriptional regulator
MTDEVAAALRRMIISRELAPGQRVTQAELAGTLGVSTMPVREALLRLVTEGLIDATSNRSFIITETTEQGVRDIYWVHGHLAGELVARAWDHRNEHLLAVLNGHYRDYLVAMPSGRHEPLFEANWAFHAAINRAADSPTILSIFRNTLRYFPDFSHEVPGWVELARDWQAGLIDEFTDGSREGARQVSSACIARSADLLVEWFWGSEND